MYQEIAVHRYRSRGPSALHSAIELPRVLLEAASLAYAWPWLASAPRGDGHPVLVLPGFTAGDESTVLLRRLLERLGYRPLPWGLGRNTGSADVQERLFDLFESLTRQYDANVSIVGQSLGGLYARELARTFSDRVRQVVSLGSPFSSSDPASTHGFVRRLFLYLSGMSPDEMAVRLLEQAEAPPVPSTAVYSRSDGVVHWSACLEYEAERSENVEVFGSHSGMAVNPLVLHVVADRLAQPEGAWRPFERRRGWRALYYPEPAARRPRTCESPACAN